MNVRRVAPRVTLRQRGNKKSAGTRHLRSSDFVLSAREFAGRLESDMGDESSILTGQPVTEHGIYQSACSCRTALTLLVGQTLPRCMGCDDAVEWRLVQEIRPSKPASSRHPSGTRYIAAKVAARSRLDSASGED